MTTEQALREALQGAIVLFGHKCSGDCTTRVWLDDAKQALALPNAAPVGERDAPSNLPAGFVPLQKENGRLVYAACLDGGRFHGWLMWHHPDGKWVSKRKLEPWEVMQAEDQDHYGIVQESGKESP